MYTWMNEFSLDYRYMHVFIDHLLSQWGPSSSPRVVVKAQGSSTNYAQIQWTGNTRDREIDNM